MTLRIPLAKCRYMTIIGAYAPTLPTEDSVKDQFYAALHSALSAVPRQSDVGNPSGRDLRGPNGRLQRKSRC